MKTLQIGEPNPKQLLFYQSKYKYTLYGGARGGGKSYAVRCKACMLALNYDGIKILIIRRTFSELKENHVIPLTELLNGIAKYKESEKAFFFPNGSRIKLGYCEHEGDVLQYQGQEWDVIFLDEATHMTEYQFQKLTEIIRGANDFPHRMYLTANPGGVGHAWVKRLFIDRVYRGKENPDDYTFIPAFVFDNTALLEKDPGYLQTLENLPEDQKKAELYGSWDVYEGQYFTEWDRDLHVIEPFEVPPSWRKYLAIDYGLDMFAAEWFAVDEFGWAYCYREFCQKGMTVSTAAEKIREINDPVFVAYGPPDLWNRRNDTGRSAADIFAEHGVFLARAQNNRVQGWYDLKEWLHPVIDEQGNKSCRLKFFRNCAEAIKCIPLLQFDEKNPNDVSTEPHEITHAPDAVRYFVAGHPIPAAATKEQKESYSDGVRELLDFGG